MTTTTEDLLIGIFIIVLSMEIFSSRVRINLRAQTIFFATLAIIQCLLLISWLLFGVEIRLAYMIIVLITVAKLTRNVQRLRQVVPTV